MAKLPPCVMQPCVIEVRSTHTSTRRGSRDTDATALAVSPQGEPLPRREVTMVTPVGKCPMTLRKCRCSGVNAHPFEVDFGLRDPKDEVAWKP